MFVARLHDLSLSRCTIFSSSELPVTLTHTADADGVYDELLKTKAFVVPESNLDRLKHWPALGSKEMEVTGIGYNESAADVILSSAGNLSRQRIITNVNAHSALSVTGNCDFIL